MTTERENDLLSVINQLQTIIGTIVRLGHDGEIEIPVSELLATQQSHRAIETRGDGMNVTIRIIDAEGHEGNFLTPGDGMGRIEL